MGRAYAGILGPVALVMVLARYLIGGGDADSTLAVAILSLFTFSAIGFLVGQVADRIVVDEVTNRLSEELKARKKADSANAAG